MRFIDLDELWDGNVEAFENESDGLLAELRNKPANERGGFITDKGNWSDIKDALAELSNGKCWYSECTSLGGDRDVDHFRPKGKIRRYPSWPETAQDPGHEGYWWLAFNWKNFRFSCRFCNSRRTNPDTDLSGGKWDFFPVRDEVGRVHSECDIDELEDEEPLLLDPTDAYDVDLLTFDQLGVSRPRVLNKSSWDYKRAHFSIDLLNLNHSDFVKARAKLGRKIKRLVRQGVSAHREYREGDVRAKKRLREIKAELRRMIDRDSDFSRFSELVLRGYRDHDWVNEIV
ncbi:hypothetical protein [Methylobacterium sp. SI9]|uniref:hypothetical protein n=1 Tax=Methylobacterium guangdongense TaxID=3138811 RepID=UPI00313DF199